jgi:hypothetical protein
MRNANDSMEERLRKERLVHSAPAGFTERVMANLPEPRSGSNKRPERPALLWPRFALGFALVAIVAVFAFEFLKEPQVGPEVALNSIEGSNASIADFESSAVESVSAQPLAFPVPNITSEQFQALTTRLDQPLEKELENVISDTRQAIQFVASNFLPEK